MPQNGPHESSGCSCGGLCCSGPIWRQVDSAGRCYKLLARSCRLLPCAQASIRGSSGAQTRSAVAGSWAVSFTYGVGNQCNGTMHLSGVDAALTGAVACHWPPYARTAYSAMVSGEFDGRVLRLNLIGGSGALVAGSCVIDLTLAPDGQSATGAGVGFGPAFEAAFNFDSYSVVLTAS